MNAANGVGWTRRRVGLATGLVFLVAVNLRPSLTVVGPLLPSIAADEGLSESAQGLLGSVPLLAFGIVSPLVHSLSRRIGAERTVLVSLIALAVGTLVRSYTGHLGLWLGTIVLGCAIAVGNVLVPVLIKRDYASRVALALAVYTAFIALPSALASAIAVPLADAIDWRGALAVWTIPVLVVLVLWGTRACREPWRTNDGEPLADPIHAPVSVWRQPTAWLVTLYMGLQSTSFYVAITWLPTIETASGISDGRAGVHLFVFLMVGVPAGLLTPMLMRRGSTQTVAAVAVSLPMVIGLIGLLVAPQLALAWAVITGAGSGASLVVALTLISVRGRTHDETTQLSGMAQSLGYLLAAVGPLMVGVLAERTGGWTWPLIAVIGSASLQLGVAVLAGRDRRPTTSFAE